MQLLRASNEEADVRVRLVCIVDPADTLGGSLADRPNGCLDAILARRPILQRISQHIT